MAPPFEANWSTLELAEVQTFLDREHEEGLTWEAKGGDRPWHDHVRRASSGFANVIGGSLILGAERDGDVWRLPGMIFPGGEASTWLSNVIRELLPIPRFDVRVFPVDDGRVVAVVAVEPIDVPPCMSGGSVFVRVSGQTVQVLDPAVLRSLFAGGEAARARATKLACATATSIYQSPTAIPDAYMLVSGKEEERLPGRAPFGLALAPVGWPSSCRHAVLTKRFGESILAAVSQAGAGPLAGPATLDISREWVQATMPAHSGAWVIRVFAEGAAAVAFSSPRVGEHVESFEVMQLLGKAWRLAVDVLEEAGAAGEGRLWLHLQTTRYPPGGVWRISPKPKIDLARRVSIEAPTEAGLASIQRELEREAGTPTWEPE